MAEVIMLQKNGFNKDAIPDDVANSLDWFGWVWVRGSRRPTYYVTIETEKSFAELSAGDAVETQPESGKGIDLTTAYAALTEGAQWHGVAYFPKKIKYPHRFRVADNLDLVSDEKPLQGEEPERARLRISALLGILGSQVDSLRILAESTGSDEAREALQAATQFAVSGLNQAPLFIDGLTLLQNPCSPDWLVRKWITTDSICCLFGESTAGKSFLAIDWALHIASGAPWNGHKVKPGAVLYICGEGHAGISRRLAAWTQVHGLFPEGRFYVSHRAILLNADGAAIVVQEIERLAVIPLMVIIDTMAWAIEGDENSAEDIGAFMRALAVIREKTKAAMMIVHHTGHGDKTRTRGSSALRAGMDAEFSVSRDPQTKVGTLACTKAKDAPPPDPLGYELQPVELPDDWRDPEEPGEPVTSLVFALAEQPVDTSEIQERKSETGVRLGPVEHIGLQALEATLLESGQFSGDVLTVVSWQWKEVCARMGISTGNAKAVDKAFERMRAGLIAKKQVVVENSACWFADSIRQSAIQIRRSAEAKNGRV